MEEHLNRLSGPGHPIAAYAEPFGLQILHQIAGDGDGAGLMEGAEIAEAAKIAVERLEIDQPAVGDIVDHHQGVLRAARYRAARREFRDFEAYRIAQACLSVANTFKEARASDGGLQGVLILRNVADGDRVFTIHTVA